ncbi:MAG: hypothetical protein ACRDDI_13450 [Aeromonas veronii]
MNNIELLAATLGSVETTLAGMDSLAALLADIREGRTHVVMRGHSCVTVAIKGREIAVVPKTLMEARRYARDAALVRVSRLPNPEQYQVVAVSQALALHRQLMQQSAESMRERMNMMAGGQK